jgi:hypothetical protein
MQGFLREACLRDSRADKAHHHSSPAPWPSRQASGPRISKCHTENDIVSYFDKDLEGPPNKEKGAGSFEPKDEQMKARIAIRLQRIRRKQFPNAQIGN